VDPAEPERELVDEAAASHVRLLSAAREQVRHTIGSSTRQTRHVFRIRIEGG